MVQYPPTADHRCPPNATDPGSPIVVLSAPMSRHSVQRLRDRHDARSGRYGKGQVVVDLKRHRRPVVRRLGSPSWLTTDNLPRQTECTQKPAEEPSCLPWMRCYGPEHDHATGGRLGTARAIGPARPRTVRCSTPGGRTQRRGTGHPRLGHPASQRGSRPARSFLTSPS